MENTFVKAFRDEENTTFTENGATTFKSTLNKNLDFFSMAGAMRGKEYEFLNLFRLAWDENPKLAVQNMFYMRDVRGGVGERDVFIKCFGYVVNQMSTKDFVTILSFVPEYGRWSDVFNIMRYVDDAKFEAACIFILKQLNKDEEDMMDNHPVSLLAKWFPLANNRVKREDILFARKLATQIYGNDKKARKHIVPLRKYINVLEQKLCAKEWGSINYETVPSIANMKYRGAFARNDSVRYAEYLCSVQKGESKINSSVSYPYDIIDKVGSVVGLNSIYPVSSTSSKKKWLKILKENETELTLLDNLWKNLPDYTNGSSSIAVVDISGSMFSKDNKNAPLPINVSISLGIYFAERNNSEFKDMFISFSEKPECVVLNGGSIAEKLMSVYTYKNMGYNTNLQAVFDAYLKIAKRSNPEDCPKNIIIISDMEFDVACQYRTKTTNFEVINEKFAEAGIARPNLVFWNVNASGSNVPVKKDENGTVLVSGYSPAIFRFICDANSTPEQFMLDTLAKYAHITENVNL